ncbi:MAG: thioredoxin domain-containing protein [bacterium]|nr:thioredoxin domain-containing protein [bacterium]
MSKQNKTILFIAAALIAVGLIFMARGNKTLGNNGQKIIGQVRPIDAADHVLGDLKAPVQMIVFSDFECPFCAQFADTMKKVEENFKDKVAIAFRHYPLPSHPLALPAAVASECAAEQGKFWEMHDKLFADNSAGKMSVEQFKKDAADLSLDAVKFNQCLDSNKYLDKVNQEKAEGNQAGVTGTPTSFINGNIYPGAYPFEDFSDSGGKIEAGMKTIISGLIK